MTKIFGAEIKDPQGFFPTPASVFVYAFVTRPGQGEPGIVMHPDGTHEINGEDWGRWAKSWEAAFNIVQDMRKRADEQGYAFDYVLVPHGFEVSLPFPVTPTTLRVAVECERHRLGSAYVDIYSSGSAQAFLSTDVGQRRTVGLEGLGLNGLLPVLYGMIDPDVFLDE